MIFDTIYEFFHNLFNSADGVSMFWDELITVLGVSTTYSDYLSVICTVVVIILGVFALFRILGGILKLFKV